MSRFLPARAGLVPAANRWARGAASQPRDQDSRPRGAVLTVSVITYSDGRQELEVLHTGPPHHTEQTIDSDRFTRQPGRTLPIAEPPDV